MTIKTQGGKVITKGGKVSCECCEEEPEFPRFIIIRELLNCSDFEIVVVYMENYNNILGGLAAPGSIFLADSSCWQVLSEFEWDTSGPPEGDGPPPLDFIITGDVTFFDSCLDCIER
jgi:hypothetical protein